jgi:hypothetical protein
MEVTKQGGVMRITCGPPLGWRMKNGWMVCVKCGHKRRP